MQIKPLFIIQFCIVLLLFGCINSPQKQTSTTARDIPIVIKKVRTKTDNSEAFFLKHTKHLKGDFNGDGVVEDLYVVASAAIPESALTYASLHAAWPFYGDGKPPVKPAKGGPVALVIVNHVISNRICHIVFDSNKVSILATQAAEDMFVVTREDASKPAWEAVGDAAKGDIIVIPTEAGIDSYLFWNGKIFQSLELLEIP